MKSVALHNLGCKVNSYEMDVMSQKLQEKGYTIVPFDARADVYVVNTCSVTNIADRKSRQMLHQAKKRNPEAVVVATGCYVQTGTELLEQDLSVDLLIGNQKKNEIAEILEAYFEEKEKNSGNKTEAENKTLQGETVTDIALDPAYDEMQLDYISTHTRAYIKIQDGCNQFCSYCIIPYARGRVRSRKEEDILKEVAKLTAQGCLEVVVTGIHISSYGMDWEKEENEAEGQVFHEQKLLHLLQELNRVEGLRRIRLGSLEPRIMTEKFVSEMAKLSRLCGHFHLSLQSGCDETLKRMNRHYTAEEYLKGVERIRKYFRNPAITTDVIAGFPGETESEFETTRNFIRQVGFYELHVFSYSVRQGTRAAEMKDQIPDPVRKRRSEELLEIAEEQSHHYRESRLSCCEEVLLEEEKTINGRNYLIGYTPEYIRCAVPAGGLARQGEIVKGVLQEFLEKELILLEAEKV